MPFTIIIALAVLSTAFLGSCVTSTGLDVDVVTHSSSHLRRGKDNIVGRRMPQQGAAAVSNGRKLKAECALFLEELCVSGAYDGDSLGFNPGLEVKLFIYHAVSGGWEEFTDGYYEDLDDFWCLDINKSVYPLEGGYIRVEVKEADTFDVDEYKAEFSALCKSINCERKGVVQFTSWGGTFSLKFSTPVQVPPDSDNDGTPDCNDKCPLDPNKTEPGECGCGISDVDSDNDGTPDCKDKCLDPNKISDIDSDSDGTPDCNDKCPLDPNKTEPGVNGCGIPDPISDDKQERDCTTTDQRKQPNGKPRRDYQYCQSSTRG